MYPRWAILGPEWTSSTHQCTSALCRMDGWMYGWMMCGQEIKKQFFSLYSRSISNPTVWLALYMDHPHLSTYLVTHLGNSVMVRPQLRVIRGFQWMVCGRVGGWVHNPSITINIHSLMPSSNHRGHGSVGQFMAFSSRHYFVVKLFLLQ